MHRNLHLQTILLELYQTQKRTMKSVKKKEFGYKLKSKKQLQLDPQFLKIIS